MTEYVQTIQLVRYKAVQVPSDFRQLSELCIKLRCSRGVEFLGLDTQPTGYLRVNGEDEAIAAYAGSWLMIPAENPPSNQNQDITVVTDEEFRSQWGEAPGKDQDNAM